MRHAMNKRGAWLGIVGVVALGLATPAVAQSWGPGYGYDPGYVYGPGPGYAYEVGPGYGYYGPGYGYDQNRQYDRGAVRRDFGLYGTYHQPSWTPCTRDRQYGFSYCNDH
jgi:hypothetical protein